MTVSVSGARITADWTAQFAAPSARPNTGASIEPSAEAVQAAALSGGIVATRASRGVTLQANRAHKKVIECRPRPQIVLLKFFNTRFHLTRGWEPRKVAPHRVHHSKGGGRGRKARQLRLNLAHPLRHIRDDPDSLRHRSLQASPWPPATALGAADAKAIASRGWAASVSSISAASFSPTAA